MAAEFCVLCGRSDGPIEEGLCADCYAKRHPLVTVVDRATVVLCPSCGSRRVGERWIPSGSGRLLGKEDLNPFLRPRSDVGIRTVEWTEVGHERESREYVGAALVRFRGTERSVPLALKVRIDSVVCPSCSRKSGHYYTAQLQLRGPDERLSSGARQLRSRLKAAWEAVLPEARSEWRSALSWAEERPEGWDFFLTDTTAARNIARLFKDRLGASLKESATLYGRKDGHDVYRVTFCVRVPRPAAPAEAADETGPELPPSLGRRRPVERHA